VKSLRSRKACPERSRRDPYTFSAQVGRVREFSPCIVVRGSEPVLEGRHSGEARPRRPNHNSGPVVSSFDTRYLLQVSLIIFRSVTFRSAYSALLDAFSTCPSFFSSAFSVLADSFVVEPVMVTWWPRC